MRRYGDLMHSIQLDLAIAIFKQAYILRYGDLML